jgi:uncharacterized repeat protein (TIGR03847 family)
MTGRVFLFDQPDRFVTGTVGGPGQRAFYLQASKAGAVITVGVEKTQVAALAQRLGELLIAAAAAGLVKLEDAGIDQRPLEEPLVKVFQVGSLAIGWDPESTRVTIEARPLSDDLNTAEPSETESGPAAADVDLLRVEMTPVQARSFAEQTATVIAAGRPACPFCGQPLDPTGHFCPRTNGQLN